MQQSLLQTYFLSLIIAVLTLAALGCAVTLVILGDDASDAWAAFGAFSVFFAGVHVQVPGTTTVPTGTTTTTTT